MTGLYFALFVVAGVSGILAPSRAIQDNVPHWGTYVWGSFYLLGGVVCLIGLIRKTRAGEMIGLPLISSASALYGIAILIQYTTQQDGAYLVVSALLIGQSLNLLERWVDAMKLFRLIQGASDHHGT